MSKISSGPEPAGGRRRHLVGHATSAGAHVPPRDFPQIPLFLAICPLARRSHKWRNQKCHNWRETACTNLICSFSSASATKLSRVALRADLSLCIGFESVDLFKSSPLQVNEKPVQQYSHSSRNYMKKLENEGKFMAKTLACCCTVSTH